MFASSLELGRPSAAALVLAAAAVALIATRSAPRWRHAPRFLLALAVALVAGDLRARDPEPPRLRIFVVDRSRSFATGSAAVQAALQLGTRDLDLARDRVAVIAFGAAPLVVLEPSSPAEAREGARRALAATVDPSSSDLGAALDLALDVARPEPASSEVVLLTDGRDTAGRARAAAARLAASRVALHAVAPAAPAAVNARVARVLAPTRVAVGEAARVVVEVEATVAGRIRTSVRTDDPAATTESIVDAAEADVPLRRTFLVRASRPGVLAVTASVALLDARDEYPQDDAQQAAILAGDRARAILVGESPAWRALLDAGSFAVETIEPGDLESASKRAPLPALVVLADVDAADARVKALEDHVGSGGGLVVAGDRHAFGPGHYADSELEARLLPVRSGPPDSRSKPLALELVIDGSGSMETKLGDGKTRYGEAVKAVVPRTEERRRGDRVGVILFADAPKLVPEPVFDGLAQHQPAGETNIGAALELGLDELAARDGRRLLVLVTDGEDKGVARYFETLRAKAEKLGPDFQAALVAVGGEGRETLERLADAIGPRAKFYAVEEAGEQLEKLVKGDLVNGSRGERRLGRFRASPGGFEVGSYAPVRPKELVRTAVTVADPERELPAALVVATERVLAVATDLDRGGAALASEGRAQLLDLVRRVARRDASDLALEAERSPGWVRILARTPRRGLFAESGPLRVPFRPIAPGELEARLPAARDARLVRIVEGDVPLAGLAIPAESSLELAPPRRDLELLSELVAPGGGRVLPDLGELPRPRPKETQRALAGSLSLAALAFLVLEGALSVLLERLAARRAARRAFSTT